MNFRERSVSGGVEFPSFASDSETLTILNETEERALEGKLSPARSVESEPLQSEFVLKFDGILPANAGVKRHIRTNERQRLLRGMLRHLREDEWLAFNVGRDEDDCFSWHISGGEKASDDGRNLSSLVSATLAGLQRSYRFSRGDDQTSRKAMGWHARVAPSIRPLKISPHSMGFGSAIREQDMRVNLPNPWIGRGERMFGSLVQLVMSAPCALEVSVCCRAKILSTDARQHLASCLEVLNRMHVQSALKGSHLATCTLLELWQSEGRGISFDCRLASDQPLPRQFLELVGTEVYGCPVVVLDDTIPAPGLDLGQSMPFSLGLPALLPSVEALAEARPARVFNIRLPRMPQVGPHLGAASCGSFTARVVLPEDGRSRHTYVVGATGTGKSTLLGNLIQQDIAAGLGVAVIDPHGDLFEYVLATMPSRRVRDVVLIEPTNSERVPGINFLDIPEGPMRRLQVNFVVTELLGMFHQLYDMRTCGGPMFELYFRNAMLLLIESRCPGATILDLARVFSDKEFRNELCSHCSDQQVVTFWKEIAERTSGDSSLANMSPYITSKLNQLTQSGPLRPIVGQERTSIDFRKTMDQRGILLVNLSKGLLGELDTRMLGMVLIGQLFSAALSRALLPHDQRVPFHLYVDEFQNFVTDSISNLVAEARKFGLFLTLANQTLAQLAAHHGQQNLLESILGNVGNMIAFRLGVPDAQRLAMFTEPELPREEMQRLPNFHAFARLITAEGPMDPFVFQSTPPSKASSHAKRVRGRINVSQAQWANPIEKIEADIAARLGSSRWAERQNFVDRLSLRLTEATDFASNRHDK